MDYLSKGLRVIYQIVTHLKFSSLGFWGAFKTSGYAKNSRFFFASLVLLLSIMPKQEITTPQ